MIPTWWGFTLLGLAAYRTWRLVAEDTILDKPRARLRLDESELVTCPWCLGAWIAVAWWGAWKLWDEPVMVVAVPFALSALVGVVAMAVDRLAE